MPAPKRQRVAPTDDWQQLRLLLDWPEQIAYELIRPVVLFGVTPGERAQQSGEQQIESVAWQPTIEEYIECRHSQNGLSRERMGDVALAFDAALREAIEGLVQGGATIVWGTPVGTRT